MADAKPMHKGGLACFPSRRRESKSEGSKLVASAFAARHSATSCKLQWTTGCAEVQEAAACRRKFRRQESIGNGPRTPRRRVAGNRGRRGGCATRFQRFEWRETCVILPEPLEFSSSVRAVGATVRASSLARSGGAAPSDREPTLEICELAGRGRVGAASISVMGADIARVSAIKDACDKQPQDPQRQAHEGKRHHGTNNHFRHAPPTWRFLRLNRQLVEQKGPRAQLFERPIRRAACAPTRCR
jgi:hypothetical protein